MTNVSKYHMGLKLISISMLPLTSNIESSRQLLKETTTILVLTDSIESNSQDLVSQKRFCVYWNSGEFNLGNYY